MPNTHRKESVAPQASTNRKRSKVIAMEKTTAKSARIRLMKERNENYLAEREMDDSSTMELRVSTAE